ncbi:mechanosensitive ion channel family protein [Methanolacinia petrolearia]|uniref:mechanosensitive ion channel family protein n=1 Tax=Methanolacinia petrolearia TaxID=54120 RepID=UPI003BA92429
MADIVNVFLNLPVGTNDLYVSDILYFVIIIIIIISTFLLAAYISKKIKKGLSGWMPVNSREMASKILYFSIVVIGFLVALPHLNVNLSGLLIAGGFLSIIIGLAGQTVIANFFSALILFFEQPIKIGDNIGVGDTLGTVEDIRILSTIIKTYDGIYTRIPNQTLFTSNITNYVAHVARRFEYSVGIRYSDDADRAIEVIWKVINRHPFALKSPSPSIYVDELGDNAVILIVRIWAPSSEWWDVRTELLWKIKLALEENGIQIPFPQRTLWFPEGTGREKSADESN